MKKFIAGFVAGVEPPLEAAIFAATWFGSGAATSSGEELKSAPEGLAPLQLCDQSGVGRGPRKTRPEEE